MNSKWNPRFVFYAAAHGKTPYAMLKHDKEVWLGGCMSGFILWIQSKIKEFVFSGKGCCKKCAGDRPDFNSFLQSFSKLRKPRKTMTTTQKILSRDGKYTGKWTGGSRPCSLEGCTGERIGVRWNDGKLTFPCSKSLQWDEKGKCWQMI